MMTHGGADTARQVKNSRASPNSVFRPPGEGKCPAVFINVLRLVNPTWVDSRKRALIGITR